MKRFSRAVKIAASYHRGPVTPSATAEAPFSISASIKTLRTWESCSSTRSPSWTWWPWRRRLAAPPCPAPSSRNTRKRRSSGFWSWSWPSWRRRPWQRKIRSEISTRQLFIFLLSGKDNCSDNWHWLVVDVWPETVALGSTWTFLAEKIGIISYRRVTTNPGSLQMFDQTRNPILSFL